MALMTWSSKYSVGVEALDSQHEGMMKILNEIHAASMQGKARQVAGPLLNKLSSLAGEHFSAEERLMESAKFPGLAAHRAQHQEMAGKVAEIVARHEKGDASAYLQFLYFMRDYQTKHMQTEDRAYATWLAARGIK
ncbi:MAG: bacteriohemerythrin [Terracidiphilus sp.]|jgi:hemerythrin